jgi:hypothetical protein
VVGLACIDICYYEPREGYVGGSNSPKQPKTAIKRSSNQSLKPLMNRSHTNLRLTLILALARTNPTQVVESLPDLVYYNL